MHLSLYFSKFLFLIYSESGQRFTIFLIFKLLNKNGSPYLAPVSEVKLAAVKLAEAVAAMASEDLRLHEVE